MINYHVLNDSIVLNYQGKTEVVARTDSRFEEILECIREERLDDIPGLMDLAKDLTNQGLDVQDGLVHVDGQPLPDTLSKRILAFNEQKLPFTSLLKFWENLKQNPSYNARAMLFAFLEHNGHPLTQDGCFIAYRGVRDDFKDCHTGQFDNSPGSICEMDRNAVDDNPNNTCSSGLHVACHNYANGFGSKTLEVKVHPRDVVAVPTDYNGTKMRVCRFEVVQECERMRQEELYTDDMSYGADGWNDVDDDTDDDFDGYNGVYGSGQ